jgi:hypothetical protein
MCRQNFPFPVQKFLPGLNSELEWWKQKIVFKLDIEDDFIRKIIEYYIERKFDPVDATKLTTAKAILN